MDKKEVIVEGLIYVFLIICAFLGLMLLIEGIINLGVWLFKLDSEDW